MKRMGYPMKRYWLVGYMAALYLLVVSSAHASAVSDGLSSYYKKDWSEAVVNFKKAMAEDPKSSLSLVYYIVSNYWANSGERVARDLEDQLVDNPNDQLAETRLGFAYYTHSLVRGQKSDKALAELRQAARMGQSSLVHTGLGIVYFDMGNLTRSKKELARAMDMNPTDVLAYEYMGRILLSFDNDPQSALGYFQQEIKLQPDYPDGHYYVAAAYDALAQTDQALSEYQNTISADPLGIGRGVDAEVGLGDLYQRNKQYGDARKAFEEALKFDPKNAAIKRRIADLDKEEKGQKTAK